MALCHTEATDYIVGVTERVRVLVEMSLLVSLVFVCLFQLRGSSNFR